jgi:transposase
MLQERHARSTHLGAQPCRFVTGEDITRKTAGRFSCVPSRSVRRLGSACSFKCEPMGQCRARTCLSFGGFDGDSARLDLRAPPLSEAW